MMYSQYLRLESKAGGCTCTNRQFVKACHSVLNKKGKSFEYKELRHDWIKSGLTYLVGSQKSYLEITR